jgi:hypothetical protein
LVHQQAHKSRRRMACFTRGEDAGASSSPPEVLSYAFVPRLLSRGEVRSPSASGNFALATYPWVSPYDGRTRHRIILSQIAIMRYQPHVIVYEADPLDWSLQSVLELGRDEMDQRGILNDSRGIYPFQVCLDVKAVEVPDPVAEGEGRKGGTVFLLSTDKGNILAFDGESLDFWGGVKRKQGVVRRLTPYYTDAEGGEGARRLRVVASGRGGPCVWDFTDALRGGWEGGREPGVLVHELEMGGEADSSVVGAAYYETSDGGHRWGLTGEGGGIAWKGSGLEQTLCA